MTKRLHMKFVKQKIIQVTDNNLDMDEYIPSLILLFNNHYLKESFKFNTAIKLIENEFPELVILFEFEKESDCLNFSDKDVNFIVSILDTFEEQKISLITAKIEDTFSYQKMIESMTLQYILLKETTVNNNVKNHNKF